MRRLYGPVFVPGRPVPQGSMTPYAKGKRDANGVFQPFRTRDGRLVLAVKASNEALLKPWRELVRKEAALARPPHFEVIDCPVNLLAEFVFARNKGDLGTGRNAGVVKASADPWPTAGRGDLSKLVRAVEDSLTDAEVWEDDKLVVTYRGCKKRWARAGEAEGVHIMIHAVEDPAPPAPTLLD